MANYKISLKINWICCKLIKKKLIKTKKVSKVTFYLKIMTILTNFYFKKLPQRPNQTKDKIKKHGFIYIKLIFFIQFFFINWKKSDKLSTIITWKIYISYWKKKYVLFFSFLERGKKFSG